MLHVIHDARDTYLPRVEGLGCMLVGARGSISRVLVVDMTGYDMLQDLVLDSRCWLSTHRVCV